MHTQFVSFSLRCGLGLTALLGAEIAHAGLTLTINSATTDSLSLSISGFLDANTTGDLPGYLAIKNNWSANIGTHTEFFSFLPTLFSSTILIGGAPPADIEIQDGAGPWLDNVYFENPLGSAVPILMNTPVSGTIVLQGVGAFDPGSLLTLQLLSGFNNQPATHEDWVRLEFTVVPESTSVGFLAIGLGGLALLRWRAFRKS